MRQVTFEVTFPQKDEDYIPEVKTEHVQRVMDNLARYGCVGIEKTEVTKKS